jgi:hypothetical protein
VKPTPPPYDRPQLDDRAESSEPKRVKPKRARPNAPSDKATWARLEQKLNPEEIVFLRSRLAKLSPEQRAELLQLPVGHAVRELRFAMARAAGHKEIAIPEGLPNTIVVADAFHDEDS